MRYPRSVAFVWRNAPDVLQWRHNVSRAFQMEDFYVVETQDEQGNGWVERRAISELAAVYELFGTNATKPEEAEKLLAQRLGKK